MNRTLLAAALLGFLANACGSATPLPTTPVKPPVEIKTTEQIITPDGATTEAELAKKGETALMARKWRDAARDFELLLMSSPNGPNAPSYLMSLATAYEGLEEREKARDKYHEVAERFPKSANARTALVRAATLHAYLEEWKALGDIGDAILKREDIDNVDRIVGLGSRGLAKVEQGDDLGASRDVLQGLDIVDKTHYAGAELLPVAAAQLRFALGEVRRIRSERIKFVPLPEDFAEKIEERCTGLLDAQQAYEQAVRSIDLHWATMAGYRLGVMYRALHHDLMTIVPPDGLAKDEKDKQIFFAFMHIRYRKILNEGIANIKLTIQLADNIADHSQWVTRAKEALKEMELSLSEEMAQLAKMPFTEDEVRKALANMAAKNKAAKAAAPSAPQHR